MGAAHQGAQAGGQLVQVDGFDEVIVGPRVQPFDAGGHGVAGGKHQHGRGVAACPRLAQHLHAVLAGQAQVEHCGLVGAGG